MVRWMGFAFISLATITCSIPTEAAYLLNCRLMGPDAPVQWRQGCKWETVITECNPSESCKIKRQNFLSLSAKAAITANVRLRTSVLVSGTTAEVAGLAAATSSPGITTSTRTTSVSGTIGGVAGTANGVVSGATGAVDRTASGLGP
jgi:hypothetical protein